MLHTPTQSTITRSLKAMIEDVGIAVVLESLADACRESAFEHSSTRVPLRMVAAKLDQINP